MNSFGSFPPQGFHGVAMLAMCKKSDGSGFGTNEKVQKLPTFTPPQGVDVIVGLSVSESYIICSGRQVESI